MSRMGPKQKTKNGFFNGPRGMTAEERFWEKVKKLENDGCWEWQGTLTVCGGYGTTYVDGKIIRAHRYSYKLHFGELPEKALVCHKCDNPKCVRPDHLFLGTYLDNNQDMVRKERHGRMIFTADQVRRLRAHYLKHKTPHRRIASFLGVSKGTITHLLNGTNWGHVK